MRRRFLPATGALLVLSLAALILIALRWPRGEPTTSTSRPQGARVISIAPAVTETLLALGAESSLVGVSDFCRIEGKGSWPRVGTAITPHLEPIARLEPTLIITSLVAGEQTGPLGRIARTEQLPWLTLDEVIGSIRTLSRLVGRRTEGDALAERMAETLSAKLPPEAPRVLLTMSYGDTGTTDVWFIRENSLHGALLRAAGGQNAVAREVTAQPRLTVEELLALDPDQIILMVDADRTTKEQAERRAKALTALAPLRAVQKGRIGMLYAPNVFSGGPGILDLVDPLRREIRRLDAAH